MRPCCYSGCRDCPHGYKEPKKSEQIADDSIDDLLEEIENGEN